MHDFCVTLKQTNGVKLKEAFKFYCQVFFRNIKSFKNANNGVVELRLYFFFIVSFVMLFKIKSP